VADTGVPAWRRDTGPQNRLPAAAAALAAAALQLTLAPRLSLHPRWLLPALELAFLLVLSVANPVRMNRESSALRVASIGLVASITAANGTSAVLLATRLVAGTAGEQAGPLLLSGGSIYLTNVLAFALWYWETDRGGPHARAAARQPHPDFLFPQMATPEVADPDWEPLFVDYLYLSFTNATAFSPTDTLPLARWAKLLMLGQAAVALVTVALVVARAVNVLR